MKKISAAFDGLKFSNTTLEYAIKLADSSNALLSGVFLDDFLYHSFNMFDVVGSRGLPGEQVKQLEEEDEITRMQAVNKFCSTCIKERVKYVTHHDKSFAIDELLKESIYSDMLLIGKDETLGQVNELAPTSFVRSLLAGTHCPVLIVPKEYKPIENIILLYDGKPSSVYAIKMFNYLLPWLRRTKVEVVSVIDPESDILLPEDSLFREFVKCHYPAATCALLKGNPQKEIIAYLKNETPNSIVILGAYQRSQVSRWIKTSMADILMNEFDLPLFIAHNKS
ncbi:universal stress protein [Mucilaginibacter paludis]|uniref:UspA domain-containing protein n=1 Tax=Mucilaginibacter paludis DSM 18603 TaxID=714943 RepID=H1YCX3_9SPHI|nr:universal stress protein [Mucilaginibacter paludis]EHQ25144.1 UspA domain-containing protein [Mucilaginibacter paludis DSM 18603]